MHYFWTKREVVWLGATAISGIIAGLAGRYLQVGLWQHRLDFGVLLVLIVCLMMGVWCLTQLDQASQTVGRQMRPQLRHPHLTWSDWAVLVAPLVIMGATGVCGYQVLFAHSLALIHVSDWCVVGLFIAVGLGNFWWMIHVSRKRGYDSTLA